MDIGNDRNTETIDHPNGHEMAVIVNDITEAEDTCPVEGKGHNYRGVPALKGVTVVHEGFVAEGRNRKTLLLEARKHPGDEKLEEEIARVHLPSIEVGAGVLSMVLSGQRKDQPIQVLLTFFTCAHIFHKKGTMSSTESG